MKPTARRTSAARRHRADTIALGERLLPKDGSLDGFIAAVGRQRGRPLHVLDFPLDPSGPSGFWMGTRNGDYLIRPATATPTRRAAITCHELAHMLLGHEPDVGDSQGAEMVAEIAALLAPDVEASVAARFLTRHGYEETQEEDAEAVATAFVATAALRQRAAATAADRVSTRLR